MKKNIFAISILTACLFAIPAAGWAASILPADFNCDGTVNSLDNGILKKYYGTKSDDEDWNAKVDLNNDGTVDLKDVQLFFTSYEGRAPGDFNEDTNIDKQDFEDFVTAFGSSYGDAEYHSRYDIGGRVSDGLIGFGDFLVFRRNYSKFYTEGHGEENCGDHRPMR